MGDHNTAAYHDRLAAEALKQFGEDARAAVDFVEPPADALEGVAAVQGGPGTPVDRLSSMSPQARWALRKAGITTLEGAAARPDEELLAIPGFGESSLVRLREWERDPSALPPPAGRFLSETREDRVHALYVALRANGQPPEKARELAVTEVDALTAQMRSGA